MDNGPKEVLLSSTRITTREGIVVAVAIGTALVAVISSWSDLKAFDNRLRKVEDTRDTVIEIKNDVKHQATAIERIERALGTSNKGMFNP